jgi:hypothetical protein
MTTVRDGKEGRGTTRKDTTKDAAPPAPVAEPASRTRADVCPECGSLMEPNGRCFVCRTCGFSKCG